MSQNELIIIIVKSNLITFYILFIIISLSWLFVEFIYKVNNRVKREKENKKNKQKKE